MSALLLQLDSAGNPVSKDPILEANFRHLKPESSYVTPLTVVAVRDSGYGLYKRTNKPTPSGTYKMVDEQDPVLNSDGIWYQDWAERDMTDAEKADLDTAQAKVEREQRDIYLVNADFSQLEDTGFSASKKAEWVTYRQALRDIPTSSGWPHNITWPTKPS